MSDLAAKVAAKLREWGDTEAADEIERLARERDEACLEAQREILGRRSAEAQVAALREALEKFSHTWEDTCRWRCESCGADAPHHEPGCTYIALMHDTQAAAEAFVRDRRIEGAEAMLDKRANWLFGDGPCDPTAVVDAAFPRCTCGTSAVCPQHPPTWRDK